MKLTLKRILEKNRRFYRQLPKKKAEASVKKTLSEMILKGADYTFPNPAEDFPSSLGLNYSLALFTSQVYAAIKPIVEFVDEPEEGKYLKARIRPDDSNKALYETYKNFAQLSLYLKETNEQQKQIENSVANTKSRIKQNNADILVLEGECNNLRESIERKRYGRKPKTEGLESELDKKCTELLSKKTNQRTMQEQLGNLINEQCALEKQLKEVQKYILLQLSRNSQDAGIEELALGFKDKMDNSITALVPAILKNVLDDKFEQQTTFEIEYFIEPMPGWRKLIMPVSITTIAGIALFVGALSVWRHWPRKFNLAENQNYVLAMTGKRGVKVCEGSEGYMINLGNTWIPIQDISPVRTEITYTEMSSENWRNLELHYDKKKGFLTPILPKNIKTGNYYMHITCTDAAGNSSEYKFEMNVLWDDRGLLFSKVNKIKPEK